MNLNVLDLKPFKKIHSPVTAMMVVLVTAAVVSVNFLERFSFISYVMQQISTYVMLIFIGLSILSAYRQKAMLKKVQEAEDFELKTELYLRLYRFRVIWSMLTGILSTLMYLSTERTWWFIFCLFDLIVLMWQKPGNKRFAMELQVDDIEYVN